MPLAVPLALLAGCGGSTAASAQVSETPISSASPTPSLTTNPTPSATTSTPIEIMTVVVSVMPTTTQVPFDLRGRSAAQASRELQQAGFKVYQQQAASEPPSAERGTVVRSAPPRGRWPLRAVS